MASFIAFQWRLRHYVGLYVVLPSAAQADLDRLHGETSHCETLFAYSTDQKIFLACSPEGTTCPTCSECHSCITGCARQCTECMRWSTYIRIYTSVAHAWYNWRTYIYARGGGCVKGNRGRGTRWWRQILDRKWKYGRLAHAQWKIRNVTLIYGRISEISPSIKEIGVDEHDGNVRL